MRLAHYLLAGSLVFGFATDARAIEVMCSDGPAACTVSNDPYQWIDCTCNGEPGFGGTGGSENPWEGFDEDQLMMACEELLPEACYPEEPTTSGGGSGTGGPGTSTSDTGPSSDTNSGSASDSSSGGGTETGGNPSTTAETASGTDSDGESGEKDSKGCRLGTDPAAPGLLPLLLPMLERRRRRRNKPLGAPRQ